MDKIFKLKEHNTTVRTEILAGISTFLAMAYILAVNPTYLSDAGMDAGAVFTATAVSAAIATLCMAFIANYPVALASGMGINAFFAYTVCGSMGCSYKVALTAILVEGIIFIILSLFRFREALVNKIPSNLKYGISAGIGLFITLVAFEGAGIVIPGDGTILGMGSFTSAAFVLALVGLVIIAALSHYKVPGAILIGILVTWIMGICAQLVGWYVPAEGTSLIPSLSATKLSAPLFFEFDFGFVKDNLVTFGVIVFTFLYSDLFDTVGTLIGVASKADLLDENGELPQAKGALLSDAIGTVVGACLGTSTVSSYVESTVGVAVGGRTGLTAVTTAVLFLISLIFAPFFLSIPAFATTPAVAYVGLLMLSAVKKIDFEADVADAIAAFLAIVVMPFTYSIANGIMFGIISWVILKILTGKIKDIHPIMWISVALFAVYIAAVVM